MRQGWRNQSFRMFAAGLIFWMLAAGLLPGSAMAGESKVDLNALIGETQKLSEKTTEMTLIWWIPLEFWAATFAQDPNMTPAQTEEFLKVLRPYTLLAVVDGAVGTFGGITYRPEAEIRSNLTLRDSKGASIPPIETSAVSGDVINLIQMMKPVLANMLGPMGENFNFYIFPASTPDGAVIADGKKKGAFSVKLDNREFRWKLPLDSLLPPKTCAKCKESCKGSWDYCPWCGTKLSAKGVAGK